jgi:hypothetical protein
MMEVALIQDKKEKVSNEENCIIHCSASRVIACPNWLLQKRGRKRISI